jgi:hypothetical protein
VEFGGFRRSGGLNTSPMATDGVLAWQRAAMEALASEKTSWLALKERAAIPDELMSAIERFDAGATTAADAAGEWTRTVALDASSARTWVLVASDSVLAFCALASSSVRLTRRQRAEVGSVYRETPATLVAWAAKAADADVEGAVLLRHADAIAQTVTRLQATCVLALDPFDEDTAELWKVRYGFKPVAPPLEEGAPASRRLWVSLEGLSR